MRYIVPILGKNRQQARVPRGLPGLRWWGAFASNLGVQCVGQGGCLQRHCENKLPGKWTPPSLGYVACRQGNSSGRINSVVDFDGMKVCWVVLSDCPDPCRWQLLLNRQVLAVSAHSGERDCSKRPATFSFNHDPWTVKGEEGACRWWSPWLDDGICLSKQKGNASETCCFCRSLGKTHT